MIDRRLFLVTAGAGLLAGCARRRRSTANSTPLRAARNVKPPRPEEPRSFAFLYGPRPAEPFPIPAVPRGVVDERHWRRRVDNPFPDEKPGTIIVDPHAYSLHLVERRGTAMRYGVGVGRQGFSWSGVARLQFKRRWPHWKVPAEMIERDPKLEKWSVENGGMPPGLDNPLGARALYLFQNGEDTLYRIHGTPEAHSIGRSVSSGCIRMLNQDVIDLFDRATHGARVIVRS